MKFLKTKIRPPKKCVAQMKTPSELHLDVYSTSTPAVSTALTLRTPYAAVNLKPGGSGSSGLCGSVTDLRAAGGAGCARGGVGARERAQARAPFPRPGAPGE